MIVVGLEIVVAQKLVRLRRVREVERAFNTRASHAVFLDFADLIDGGALADQKSQRVNQNRFTRAGFAGEHVESSAKLHFGAFNQCEVVNTKFK